MSEHLQPYPFDINQAFASRDLNQDSRWQSSAYADIPVITYGVDTQEQVEEKSRATKERHQRVIVHTKAAPNLRELLESLYPDAWAPQLAELLVDHGFEKAEIIEGLQTKGFGFLRGKSDELGLDKAYRELLVRYVEQRTSIDLDAFIQEVRSTEDIRSDEYEIDRLFMDIKAHHPPATFRNQTVQPNGLNVSAPVADLVSIKNDKLDKDTVMALPAKSLVYFGVTSFNNCFVVVDAK